MLQSTRTIEEPPMAMVRSAFGSWQVVVTALLSVCLRKRGFLAFECEKPSKICTCMRELDTVKYQVPEPQIWTSLQLYRLRMAESSHSLVIGHSPDLQPLPRKMAINENYHPQSIYQSLKKRTSGSGFVKMSAFCSVVLQ